MAHNDNTANGSKSKPTQYYREIHLNTEIDGDPDELDKQLNRIIAEACNSFAEGVTFELHVIAPKDPLDIRVEDPQLGLSTRAVNCCAMNGIRFIGQLVRATDNRLRKTKNVGKATIREIDRALKGLGLKRGMRVKDWLPPGVFNWRLDDSDYFFFSRRASDAMVQARCVYVGELLQRTEGLPEADGRTMKEIDGALRVYNLRRGMDIGAWPNK